MEKNIGLKDAFTRKNTFITLVLFVVSVVLIEFVIFYVWTYNMRNANYYDPVNKEFHTVNLLENIIYLWFPILVGILGSIITKYDKSGLFAVLCSFPFIFTFCLYKDKSVIQACDLEYWFFIPAVIFAYFLQILLSLFFGKYTLPFIEWIFGIFKKRRAFE